MKQKDTRLLILSIERDSVCAGDDVDAPHEARIAVRKESSLAAVLRVIQKRSYLAGIAGGRATWIVESDRPLAVMAQQWTSPRFLIDPATRIADCMKRDSTQGLFFRYWCQVDLRLVYSCLRAGAPLPDQYDRDRPKTKGRAVRRGVSLRRNHPGCP